MNAIEFIQRHGVELAKECIEEANAYSGFWVNAKTLELSNQIPSYDAVSIPAIQRLVESVDIIREFGGCEEASNRAYELTMQVLGFDPSRIEQAIADYESIYGGEHV